MEGILQGIPNVSIYIDDILVTEDTEASHLETLSKVLDRLQAAGLKLKKSKCEFMRDSVEYLGYVISAQGIQPMKEKIQAVCRGTNPQELDTAKVLLRFGELLWEIPPTARQHPGSTAQPTPKEYQMGLGSQPAGSL